MYYAEYKHKDDSLLASICLEDAPGSDQLPAKGLYSFMVVRRTNIEQTAKLLKSDSVAICLLA